MADGKVDGNELVKDYLEKYVGDGNGPDHDALYAGKVKGMNAVGSQVSLYLQNVDSKWKNKGCTNEIYERTHYEKRFMLFDQMLKDEQKEPKTPKELKAE